jgi:hypothetical protein
MGVGCLPAQDESSVQRGAASALQAPPLWGRRWQDHWGPERLGRQTWRPVVRHQPIDAAGGRGAPTVSRPGPNRGGHARLQGSTQLDRLSSALGAGPATPYDLLPRRFLCAGTGTVRARCAHLQTQAGPPFQRAYSWTPSAGAVEKRRVTSDFRQNLSCQIGHEAIITKRVVVRT